MSDAEEVTDGDAQCECILRRETDDQTVCNVESENGNLCGRPDNHDGPHVACSVAEHPVEVFEAAQDGDGDE